MAESEIDDFTKIGGWVEMDKLNPKYFQLGVTISDVSEDSFGWGTSLSGMIGNSINEAHFQAESYLKFNMGNNSCLKPSLVLGIDGKSKTAALMLRSNCSLINIYAFSGASTTGKYTVSSSSSTFVTVLLTTASALPVKFTAMEG
ncbi:hypothetical protein JHK87_014058 [Glycine soja]|nr:hypothetical protein JHK87_014058 [Glycine soja]